MTASCARGPAGGSCFRARTSTASGGSTMTEAANPLRGRRGRDRQSAVGERPRSGTRTGADRRAASGSADLSVLHRAAWRPRRASGPRRSSQHAGWRRRSRSAPRHVRAACPTAPRRSSPRPSRVATGERLVWIARDAEIADRVAEELAAWLGWPGGGRHARAANGAGIRALGAGPRRERGARRRARGLAMPDGRPRARRERPGAVPAHARARPICRPSRSSSGRGQRSSQERVLRDAGRPRLRGRARGRRPRRVRAARRHRRRVPGRPAAAGAHRVVRRRDRVAARVRPGRPARRRAGASRRPCCRRASSCCRPRSGAASLLATRLGRTASRLPERLAADLRLARDGAARRRRRDLGRPPRAGHGTRPPRRRGLGDRRAGRGRRPRPTSCGRRRTSDATELEAAGELPKGWPEAYLAPARLEAPRCTRRGPWSSPGSARLDGAPPGGNPFGWHEPVLPPAAIGSIGATVARWRREGARVVLASDQSARLAEILAEADIVAAPVHRPRRGAACGRPGADRPQPQRRVSPAVRTASSWSPTASCSAPSGSVGRGRCVGSCHATSWSGCSRATWSSTSTTAWRATPASCVARPGARATRSATSWSCTSRARTGSGCRSSRSSASRRYAGGESPPALAPGRRGVAAGPGRRVRKAVSDLAKELLELYAARARRARPAFGRGHALAAGDGGRVPVRGDARPAALRRRGQGRPGARAPDGPAGRGRRRLRQDRGRPARRVQGDPGRHAGRRARADDRARGPAPGDVPRSGSRPTRSRSGCSAASCRRRSTSADPRRARGGLGRPRHRHPPAAVQGHPLPRPRPGRRRRGAALRRRPQGAPQADADRGPRPDAVGDAHPADAQPGARRRPRHERHRDAARGSAADPDARRRGVGRPRPRRDPARARPGRPGLLRPQPRRDHRGPGRAAATTAAARRGSWSATARCPRARWSG